MKMRSSAFCVTLALMTSATLLIGVRSEPTKTNTDSNDVSVESARTPNGTEPVAPSPKANAIKKTAQPARLSFGVDEVVKMHQGGVESDVILNYIENSS